MSDEEDKDLNFLKRWSGRKTALREKQPNKQAIVSDYDEVALPDRQDENEVENMAIPEDLPDVDALNKDSDFSLFMREGTPEHLKKIALRKLFNSDPAFSVLDGLNDYDEAADPPEYFDCADSDINNSAEAAYSPHSSDSKRS